MTTKHKKVLLIEPDYNNKFPPVALMKLATYYRNRGDWDVYFYKGDLKLFVIERITDRLVLKLNELETNDTHWEYYKHELFEFIKTKKINTLDSLPIEQSEVSILLKDTILDAKEYYWKKKWENEPEWDRIGITTLFTFYWDKTIETIEFAKKLVKDKKELMIGGVLASIQPDEIEAATGIRPHVGLLNHPGDLDKGDKQIIDELELDYSILDEIDYQYPMTNAYYRYATRGCIRKCSFCAVSTLEPEYQSYILLKVRIDNVAKKYGHQKDLLLMDNNILESKDFERIIKEIHDSGFERGAKFQQQNLLEISIKNLKAGFNDRAYIRKTWRIYQDFYNKLKNPDESYKVFCIIEKYHLIHQFNATKENILKAYDEIKDLYNLHFNPGKGRLRFVDFNQGVDARLFTPEIVKTLSTIAIRPLRIAFDDIRTKKFYEKAIRMSVDAGLKDFSNYLLYNFEDHPDDLYERLRFNVELSEELSVSIYSFPMKFHPIRKTPDMDQDYSHNRDYIGKHWNRKYIRAIQAILNSTKGKIGRGREYFDKAFGKDIKEFHKLLEMPETLLIYRFFFEWLELPAAHEEAIKMFGVDDICKWSSENWWNTYNKCKTELSNDEWNRVEDFIHKNKFDDTFETDSKLVKQLLEFYNRNAKSMVEKDSDLFQMKLIYDKQPIIKNRIHKPKYNEEENEDY